jgi:hypothetical protein
MTDDHDNWQTAVLTCIFLAGIALAVWYVYTGGP